MNIYVKKKYPNGLILHGLWVFMKLAYRDLGDIYQSGQAMDCLFGRGNVVNTQKIVSDVLVMTVSYTFYPDGTLPTY